MARISSVFVSIALLLLTYILKGQDNCNKLGAWLWYIEISGFGTHEKLADSLSTIGVKRIYVKVADGKPNPSVWPELLDKNVVNTYKSRGLEVWAWSYNYPGNEAEQATALRLAAETGYDGFVVDVESEFDNKPVALNTLFSAFATQKAWVRSNLTGKNTFSLYCTTWGNPIDHNFSIKDIDPFVDGYKPQTYVENWGTTYMNNLTYWINFGSEEYKQLGATKPIHHIVSTEKGVISSDIINSFFRTSGPESSIWVVPGSNTNFNIWASTWRKVDWKMNFCSGSTEDQEKISNEIKITPNPASGKVKFISSNKIMRLVLYNISMQQIDSCPCDFLDTEHLEKGLYIVTAELEDGTKASKKLIVH
jgi:hypothetical protein